MNDGGYCTLGCSLVKQPPFIILDVHGVGYEVHMPVNSCNALAHDETITLFIHMAVREDAQLLYGFITERERHLFRILIKVSGVGPKLALTILSGIDPPALIRAVQANDVKTLTKIPGIGKKTPERLLIETRDELINWQASSPKQRSGTNLNHLVNIEPQPLQDAICALTTLGYKPHEARQVMTMLYHENHTTEELIRLALQQLSKRIPTV